MLAWQMKRTPKQRHEVGFYQIARRLLKAGSLRYIGDRANRMTSAISSTIKAFGNFLARKYTFEVHLNMGQMNG